MMGSTAFKFMTPGKPGQLLFESFESLDWQLDEGWTVVAGNPQATDTQAFEGQRSLAMDATFPLITKMTAKPFKWSVAYFLDDPSVVAGNSAPFVQWKNAAGKFSGLGVDFAVSTVNYTFMIDDVKFDSGIPRTAAWRRFTFEVGGIGVIVGIDGTTFPGATASSTFKDIFIGDTIAAGTPFGFFDAVQVAASKFLKFFAFGEGDVVQAFREDRTLIGTATIVGGEADLDVSALDAPFEAYVRVDTPGGDFRFISDVRAMFAGDAYIYNTVDFGRRVTMLDLKPQENIQDKESNSGKNESVFFSAREAGMVNLAELTEDQREALFPWWSWAKPRNVWSLAIEAGKEAYSFLAGPAGPGDTNVTLDSVAGIHKGMKLLLSSVDNSLQETVEVDYIVGNTVFFTAPNGIIGSYLAGDYVRTHLFLPFVLSTDTALGLTVSTLKQRRWTLTHNFRENL